MLEGGPKGRRHSTHLTALRLGPGATPTPGARLPRTRGRRLPPSWRPVQPRTLAGASVWRARHLQRLQLQARLQLPAPPPPPPRWSLYAPIGVLSTSNRKPPLRIPLRRVAEILTHPGQVEVVSPKRV